MKVIELIAGKDLGNITELQTNSPYLFNKS